MDQTSWWLTASGRHEQNSFEELSTKVAVRRPIDDFIGCHILDSGDIEVALASGYIDRATGWDLIRQVGRSPLMIMGVKSKSVDPARSIIEGQPWTTIAALIYLRVLSQP